MAVFYKWIKGCGTGGDLTNTPWTYVKWGTGQRGKTTSIPTLHITDGKNDSLPSSKTSDVGYIITNNGPDSYFKQQLFFGRSIFSVYGKAKDNSLSGEEFNPDQTGDVERFARAEFSMEHQEGEYRSVIAIREPKIGTTSNPGVFRVDAKRVDLCGSWSNPESSSAFLLYKGNDTQSCSLISKGYARFGAIDSTTNTDDIFSFVLKVPSFSDRYSSGVDLNGKVIIFGRDEQDKVSDNVTTNGCLLEVRSGARIGAKADNVNEYVINIPRWSDSSGKITINRDVEIDSHYCQAAYFNATSDKRAKENITPATYDALNLIKNLPIYNFNYKSRPEETVTGILAQDLLEVQPEGLDLVSNIDATGENNDYMSIKNDKLMFVLMKAIQEQQEQIETLKAEIEKLKA